MSQSEKVEKLIDLYGNDVLRIANMYTKNLTIAEDIFQEVFLKVTKKLHLFKNESSEKTWIIRITINTCKDYLKSSWKTKVIPSEDVSEQITDITNPDDKILTSEMSKIILKEIFQLPVIYKDVILLYYYKSFSTSEIAKILMIPEATVRIRMKRAREILKEKLKIFIEE
ncbi:MAG: sigma-70 family RNA polymerase sigma factor [Clostridia bacterium]|nr:sigma-70 family RNA polymerase sigma factor [Clostridia bacterium]